MAAIKDHKAPPNERERLIPAAWKMHPLVSYAKVCSHVDSASTLG